MKQVPTYSLQCLEFVRYWNDDPELIDLKSLFKNGETNSNLKTCNKGYNVSRFKTGRTSVPKGE